MKRPRKLFAIFAISILFVMHLNPSRILGKQESVSEPTLAERQIVLETEQGRVVLELFPEAAPNHVERFRQRILEQFYVGTSFHRGIPMGIIQGGDPLTKDPSNFDRYGSGGLIELDAEFNQQSHVRGAVSAVLVPGNPDSAGSQFFICVTDQTQLDGQYTVFGRVVEGMGVVQKISMLPTDAQQRILERVVITATYERERPAPEKLPFTDDSAEELAQYHVIITTELGEIELELFPDVAPEHVRQFLRFSELGLYDGTLFHRIVPGFVIQGGALSRRQPPVPEKYARIIKALKAEFNDQKHIRGTLSMARAENPDSAVDSFFITLAPQPGLDGNYTVFGRVVRGIDTVDGLSQIPTQGETPIVPIKVGKMQVVRQSDR